MGDELKRIDAKIHIKVGDICIKVNMGDAKKIFEELNKVFGASPAGLSPQPNSSTQRHDVPEYLFLDYKYPIDVSGNASYEKLFGNTGYLRIIANYHWYGST